MATKGYQAIEDYGVIGDLSTIALVGHDGSIDYMCFPELDSPTVFGALLDAKKGGYFQIAPDIEVAQRRQMYLPDTNILLSRFYSQDGLVELSDFMPVSRDGGGDRHDLVRRVKVVRGDLSLRMECRPRFDYARAEHRVEREGPRSVVFLPEGGSGQSPLRLRASIDLELRDGDAVASFRLAAGEHAWFVLEMPDAEGGSALTEERQVTDSFKATADYWRRWIGRARYTGRWREEVHRSALALKLLTSERHGSIAAAATFSLPEVIGGERNWDYRYVWIRDAAFTVYSLMRLGFTDETERFMGFIEARMGELEPDGSLQVLYGLDGRHQVEEETLGHLEGYRASAPVRIGNEAYRQLQLDIYGELMDSVYLFDRFGYPISYDLWRHLVRLMDWVSDNWAREDRSIWEIRGKNQHFLYSRLMCWVAFDRAIRLARKRSLPGPVERWLATRDEIHREIFEEFWNPSISSFVQTKGSDRVDASHLLMPLVRFISPRDPRWLSTLARIREELAVDALVHRYADSDSEWDGLRGTEGTFTMCSFWLAEAVGRAGDLEQARFLLEKMLGYANHLGLYAEELSPCGEHLGNYPQAFTHLGLISAAFDLDRRLDRAHHD